MSTIALTALALVLAATAGFFSIVGLREFAPGAALAVTFLGATVEIAKLVVAAWLKSAWSTMPRWMRASGCAFVLLIMLLTGLGTYAFLTAAHGGQAAGRDAYAQAVQAADASIELHHQALDGARKEEAELRAEYDAFIAAGKVSKASGARQADADQLADIRRRVEREQTALEQAQADRATAQQALTGQAAELGPVRSLADLIGGSETTAVNLFIGLLMAVFDPLAVWLSMAASHAAKMARIEREQPRAGPAAEAVPELVPAPIAEAVEVAKVEEPPPLAEIVQAVQVNAGAVDGTEEAPPPGPRKRGQRGPDKKRRRIVKKKPQRRPTELKAETVAETDQAA